MYPYSGLKLIQALEKQHKARSTSDLFKSGTFRLNWRAKVGSFPHADLETLVSAGEPCGAWSTVTITKEEKVKGNKHTYTIRSRPEDKREIGDNWQALKTLPLHGYLPGASIRGVVRAWATQYPELQAQVLDLLGSQDKDNHTIIPGKIEFLDAFPTEPTQLSLDIVNPQQDFQVFHDGQSKPLSLYTLGDGQDEIEFIVGIRGTQKAKAEDVQTVWDWVQQALSSQGLGSRRASGYGSITAPEDCQPKTKLPQRPKTHSTKVFTFTLYSQGNAGPDMRTMELRPSHWRGWLRSWLLRFFLGVMTPNHAKATVGELLGTLEDSLDSKQRQGDVQLKLVAGKIWGERSINSGASRFYKWQGTLNLTAPKATLDEIIVPILRLAVMVGGVGRGWRRPLHRFMMQKRDGEEEASRGCHLDMKHQVKPKGADRFEDRPFGLALKAEEWQALYEKWCRSVQQQWPDRYQTELPIIQAEVFSPRTCAIYLVPGPDQDPIESIDQAEFQWRKGTVTATRGEGMNLIYRPTYKRKPDVGGDAGQGDAYCSWVSIKRVKRPKEKLFNEVVCLFLGDNCNLRSQFLRDLANISEKAHLFGMQPPHQP